MGYDEDAGYKIYRLYDPEHKTIIRSREVVIDESLEPAGEVMNKSLRAKIEWDAETSIEEEKISERTSEKFDPIERIAPTPTSSLTTTPTTTPTQEENNSSNIRETIIVPLPLAQLEGTEREDRRPQDPGLRRSERNRQRENLFSAAHFVLMANLDRLEPQTLTEALNSTEKEK